MIGPTQRSSGDCSLDGHVALSHEMPDSEQCERHVEQCPGYDAWRVPTHLERSDKMERGVRDEENRQDEPAQIRVRRVNCIPEVDPGNRKARLFRARERDTDTEHEQERTHGDVVRWSGCS